MKESCCIPPAHIGKESKQIQQQNPTYQSVKSNEVETNPMVFLEGGKFYQGTDDGLGHPDDQEGPARLVSLAPFYIDPYAVTNFQFSQFVEATAYMTEAESLGWSYVFYLLLPEEVRQRGWTYPKETPWWAAIQGASWQQPEGPGSTIGDRLDHPVVHVTYRDALAYCKWAGKRLPTEAEWEYAAAGRTHQQSYPWGEELQPGGKHLCNIWQGEFPRHNTKEDGYLGTAPVDEYEANDFGLYQVIGNVWEWTQDPFYWKEGSEKNNSILAAKGGSYLCHDSYCNRYRIEARMALPQNSSSGNLGFRCARDA